LPTNIAGQPDGSPNLEAFTESQITERVTACCWDYTDICAFLICVVMFGSLLQLAILFHVLSPLALQQPTVLLQGVVLVWVLLALYATLKFRHGGAVWRALGWTLGVTPEKSELRPVSPDHEYRWTGADRRPTFAHRGRVLTQAQFGQTCVQALTNDPAVAQFHFVHAMTARAIRGIPQGIDHKHAHARKRQKRFSAPLLSNVARRHHQGGVWPAFGMCMHGTKRDKGFACAAFRNHGTSTSLLPNPGQAHYGQSLCEERFAKQLADEG